MNVLQTQGHSLFQRFSMSMVVAQLSRAFGLARVFILGAVHILRHHLPGGWGKRKDDER